MKAKVRLPLFSDEILKQIIWAMENQKADYYLNIKDGSLFCPEIAEQEVPEQYLVQLPKWGSSEGYQMMVSFLKECKRSEIRNDLSRELNSKTPGVFRRYRDVLSKDPDALKQFYDFKDKRMKAYIRTYFKDLLKSETPVEDLDEEEPVGEILADFEILHLQSPSPYSEEKIAKFSQTSPIEGRALSGFSAKQAFEVSTNDKTCGTLVYEIVEGTCVLLYYYIEENYRGLGLFSLMLDHLNRELSREHINKVVVFFKPEKTLQASFFSDHEVKSEKCLEAYEYEVKAWNCATESSEYVYVL